MATSLVQCFQYYCPARLKELINSCSIKMKQEQISGNWIVKSISTCEIYAPLEIVNEVKSYRGTLNLIGEIFNIKVARIIPLSPEQSIDSMSSEVQLTNTSKWVAYIKLQYLSQNYQRKYYSRLLKTLS